MKHVVIVGGGFTGINAARELGNRKGIRVTLIDRNNYHLFQPLLYQVAISALKAGEISYPLRKMLSRYGNISIHKGSVQHIDLEARSVHTDSGDVGYDYLVMACGSKHHYFGNNEWEEHAPGLKTIAQASEMRRRVMEAFEHAERSTDPAERRKLLTFVIVGGGPTGVELAGSIGEMSRFYLPKYFRNIDPRQTRIFIVHSGSRILGSFSPELSNWASRTLEKLGVQIWTSSRVERIDSEGVRIGDETIVASTVLWAAGVRASSIGRRLGIETDAIGRIVVTESLSVPGYSEVFCGGDQSRFEQQDGQVLPGLASVAIQQGRTIGRNIRLDIDGLPPRPFRYSDKGEMATIGKNRAIAETGRVKLRGMLAWIAWMLVHIYYLNGFKHRFFVILQWAWSWFTFGHGARIVNREWRFYSCAPEQEPSPEAAGSEHAESERSGGQYPDGKQFASCTTGL